MSRLQVAVDAFAADWLARTGEKPAQDTVLDVLDGEFCSWTDEPFCLCLKLATGIGGMINFTGPTCKTSGKPVTADSYAWMDEAISELRARSEWLAHLRYCTRCPTDLCDRGEELAAAVRETMAPEESWAGVWAPKED